MKKKKGWLSSDQHGRIFRSKITRKSRDFGQSKECLSLCVHICHNSGHSCVALPSNSSTIFFVPQFLNSVKVCSHEQTNTYIPNLSTWQKSGIEHLHLGNSSLSLKLELIHRDQGPKGTRGYSTSRFWNRYSYTTRKILLLDQVVE